MIGKAAAIRHHIGMLAQPKSIVPMPIIVIKAVS